MISDPIRAAADDPGDTTFAGQDYNESIDIAIATIQQNQVALSQMADMKANILITVSSILLTLAVGKFEQRVLVVPSMLVALFCVPALVFAILCVMPSAAARKPVDGSETLPHFNPLFFMHFTLLPLRRHEREMERALTNPQSLYQALSRDIYHAGMVLRMKKYRYLRWSYISLLFGAFSSCLSLLIEFASTGFSG